MESRKRAITKALSYRALGTITTASIAWAFTKRVELAVGIGLFDVVFKTGGYYLHERMWNRLSYGRGGAPQESAAPQTAPGSGAIAARTQN